MAEIEVSRYKGNPIVTPGKYAWRMAATFNPAAILENDTFYLFERAAGSLRPFYCSIGLMQSKDGFNFVHKINTPLLTPEALGYPHGSLQDPRIVKIEGRFYLSFALRPYAYNCFPTGVGVPEYLTPDYPELKVDKDPGANTTRSGIAISDDLIHFDFLGFTAPPCMDDRDNILFPEKIDGRFALLRRPLEYVGEHYGTPKPGIWLSYSKDLSTWTEPRLIAKPENVWENKKIGGSAPPVKTEKGWLMLYHGVDDYSVYRVGAMLLDISHPEKIIGRTRQFIMEPENYYERIGMVIPNVIFPTGNIVKDGLLYIYYGCGDTSISVGVVPLVTLLDHLTS